MTHDGGAVNWVRDPITIWPLSEFLKYFFSFIDFSEREFEIDAWKLMAATGGGIGYVDALNMPMDRFVRYVKFAEEEQREMERKVRGGFGSNII